MGQYVLNKDQFGYLHAYGWVENHGATPVSNVQVAMSLLDAGGKTLAADNAIYTRRIIPAGERSPFLIQFDSPPDKWATEKVQVQASPFNASSFTASMDAKGLSITDSNLTRGRTQSVSGQVTNNGTKAATLVQVLSLFYDPDGKPLYVGQTFSKLNQVPPGESAPFSLDLPSTIKQVDKFDLFVEGDSVP